MANVMGTGAGCEVQTTRCASLQASSRASPTCEFTVPQMGPGQEASETFAQQRGWKRGLQRALCTCDCKSVAPPRPMHTSESMRCPPDKGRPTQSPPTHLTWRDTLPRHLPNRWHERPSTAKALPVKNPDTHAALSQIAELQSEAAARPPRFYLPPSAGTSLQGPVTPSEVIIDGEEAKHAIRVLRLRPGDRVELADGHGALLPCILTAADKARSTACLAPDGPVQVRPWASPRWTLAVGLPAKGSRADWLVEKACELGAYELIPLSTERCQYASAARGGGSKRARTADECGDSYEPTRLQRVAVAAMKQCLREHALVMGPPITVDQLVRERIPAAELTLVAAAGGRPVHQALSAVLSNVGSENGTTSKPRLLCVGPEGDWTPAELAMLVEAGAVPVGLGRLRLRTETACLSLLSAASAFST